MDSALVGDLRYEANVRTREALLKKMGDRGGREAEFKMCRRVGGALDDPLKRMEWDRIDRCRCGAEVIYDARDSEGKVHICMPCAHWYMNHGAGAQLEALDAPPVTDREVNDADLEKAMQKSYSQLIHGEMTTRTVESHLARAAASKANGATNRAPSPQTFRARPRRNMAHGAITRG